MSGPGGTELKRILITGGTGFIGSALVERLLARGIPVDILTRRRQRAEAQFLGRVRAVESLDELGRAPPDTRPNVIVNLAGKNLGEERWNERVKREIVASRVELTRHVIDYLSRADPKPRMLISGSAVGYYGARGSEVLGESASASDEYQSRLCVQWEAVANRAADYGVRTCISRTGVVIGPRGGILSGLVPLFAKGLGAIVGDGKQWVSWIHIDDLLTLFEECIDDDTLAGAFNNTAPRPVTHEAFCKTLGRVLHRPVVLRIPAGLYRLIVGELAHLHATGQRVAPVRHIERGFDYRYPELEPALRAALDVGR